MIKINKTRQLKISQQGRDFTIATQEKGHDSEYQPGQQVTLPLANLDALIEQLEALRA